VSGRVLRVVLAGRRGLGGTRLLEAPLVLRGLDLDLRSKAGVSGSFPMLMLCLGLVLVDQPQVEQRLLP
jgi:hypothetical protein